MIGVTWLSDAPKELYNVPKTRAAAPTAPTTNILLLSAGAAFPRNLYASLDVEAAAVDDAPAELPVVTGTTLILVVVEEAAESAVDEPVAFAEDP